MRRKKVNDADVISDGTIVDEENVNQKKLKKQFAFFNRQQNNNLVVEYEDIEVDKSEVFYDGQLFDIAVKKKIIKKKGNWYLYGDEKLGYGLEKAKFFLLENPNVADEISSQVNNVMDVGSKQKEIQNLNISDSVNSGTQLYVSPNAVQNQRSLGFMNQRLEVELSEIYVKSKSINTLDTLPTVPLLFTTLFISNISSNPVFREAVVPPE